VDIQPIQLSVSQSFEVERFNRAIDETKDLDALRSIAKDLLRAWMTQKAATTWVMKDSMNPISGMKRFKELLKEEKESEDSL
jgi:hypothetical protein